MIACERHEARRVDRQLFGRSGGQGDPGSAIAFVSCEDELLLRFVPKWLVSLFTWSMKNHIPGAKLIGKITVFFMQWKAQKVAFYSRISVMKMDTWLDEAISFTGKTFL